MKTTFDFSKGVDLTMAPQTREQEVLQNLYVLLNTVRGSVPFYREFGLDNSFKHKPIQAAQTLYASAVSDAVERFMPEIRVDNISFAGDSDEPSTLSPILEVTIFE